MQHQVLRGVAPGLPLDPAAGAVVRQHLAAVDQSIFDDAIQRQQQPQQPQQQPWWFLPLCMVRCLPVQLCCLHHLTVTAVGMLCSVR